eukprot:scaffold371459_cov18-Prasinocladus_malaysianus.AAC.1
MRSVDDMIFLSCCLGIAVMTIVNNICVVIALLDITSKQHFSVPAHVCSQTWHFPETRCPANSPQSLDECVALCHCGVVGRGEGRQGQQERPGRDLLLLVLPGRRLRGHHRLRLRVRLLPGGKVALRTPHRGAPELGP